MNKEELAAVEADQESTEAANRIADISDARETPQPIRNPGLLPRPVDLTVEEGALCLAAIQVYWDQGVRHPVAAQWAVSAQGKLQAAGAVLPQRQGS